MEWFYYDLVGDYFNPQSFNPVTVPICPGNIVLCAIKAFRQYINGQPRPIITPSLQAEITSAHFTGNESANVLLRSYQG